jgi:signal transduction histidine kinase
MDQARLRRLIIWMVALIPPALVAWTVTLHSVPEALQGQAVHLTGDWKRSPDDEPAFAGEGVDDGAWKEIRFPSFAPNQRHPRWARRTFDLPPSLEGRSLTLVAGGLWPGTEIYINGVRVARADLRTRGTKVEYFGLDSFEIPAERFRPGRNLIAMRADQLVLYDSRLFLAETEATRDYVLHNLDLKRGLLFGSLSLLVFFGVLLAAFYLGEDTRESRAQYLSALHTALGGAAYLAMCMNVFGLREQSKPHLLLNFASIFYALYGVTEFVDVYILKRTTRFRRANRWISGACVLILLGVALVPDAAVLYAVWGVLSTYTLVAMGMAGFNLGRGALRGLGGFGPMLLSAMGVVLAVGVTDTLTHMGVASFPRLAPLATGNLAMAFAVLIVADFLRLSYVNKELSSSLASANQSLSQALVQAQESARLKSEFVANISHELRTPLNAIINIPDGLVALFGQTRRARCRGCSELFELSPEEVIEPSTACPTCAKAGTLQETPGWQLEGDAEEVVRQLSTLGRSGRNLLSLIDNVLDFSKLEAGRMTISLSPVKLATVVGDVLESLSPLARKKKIEVANLVAGGAPDLVLRADPVKLSQILTNLVGNAVKFSLDQGTVQVAARRDGDWVELSVRDEGIGIPASAHSLIFESFRQVDGSHTRRFGGTGLGLAITKQLVELHGGRIWVSSEPNRGSTFFVRLPIAGPAVGGSGEKVAPVLPAAPPAPGPALPAMEGDRAAVEAARAAQAR